MKEADKGGDLVSKSELEQQRLKMRIMTDRLIDRKVEKSESRVIAAIRELRSDLKSEISAVNRKVDGLAAEVASVRDRVGSRLVIQTWSVIGWTTVMFFGQVGFLTWLFPGLVDK
ncbi:MAG: hypothetical protein OXD44_03520 [Gammaproteobacteria bacterium]|nr:hypothetical protein [Gammaproteobacteria bacterium]MCY4312763.1 hypothetical protein [Gammaproteobacteria bacterium]